MTIVSVQITGRKLTFSLYPVSYREMSQSFGVLETRAQIERWSVWGGYPAIVTTDNPVMCQRLLGELVGSYLYRDILELEGIRRADKIADLLRLLAFQIGQEVSVAELATSLALNRQTVERYLDLLERVFVIFKVGGRLYGYEFKWQSGEIRRATRNEFLEAYPGSKLISVNQENLEVFLE